MFKVVPFVLEQLFSISCSISQEVWGIFRGVTDAVLRMLVGSFAIYSLFLAFGYIFGLATIYYYPLHIDFTLHIPHALIHTQTVNMVVLIGSVFMTIVYSHNDAYEDAESNVPVDNPAQ